jgi:hypothetical protein
MSVYSIGRADLNAGSPAGKMDCFSGVTTVVVRHTWCYVARRGMNMRRVLIATVALLAAAILPLGVPAQAQSPPHVFVGEVTLDGVPAPDGTVIGAVVNGQVLSRAETTVREGKFTLIVEQPEGVGGETAVIGFSVGDFMAQQSHPWNLGEITVVTLTASSALPSIATEIDPQPPERLIRGEEFLLTTKANTGFYKATGGEVKVNLDPKVFSNGLENTTPLPSRAERTFVEHGQILGSWTYPTPTSTAVHLGELFTLPLRVRDSAHTGPTSLSIEVRLFGPTGEPFPLEPNKFSHEIAIVGQASDLNEDGSVDFADLAALGSVWGKKSGEAGFHANFDLDGDGTIWIGDLVILLQNYGDTA